jgi:hypothetical protein
MIRIIEQRGKCDQPNGQEEQAGADRGGGKDESPIGSRCKQLASFSALGTENVHTGGADFIFWDLSLARAKPHRLKPAPLKPEDFS